MRPAWVAWEAWEVPWPDPNHKPKPSPNPNPNPNPDPNSNPNPNPSPSPSPNPKPSPSPNPNQVRPCRVVRRPATTREAWAGCLTLTWARWRGGLCLTWMLALRLRLCLWALRRATNLGYQGYRPERPRIYAPTLWYSLVLARLAEVWARQKREGYPAYTIAGVVERSSIFNFMHPIPKQRASYFNFLFFSVCVSIFTVRPYCILHFLARL